MAKAKYASSGKVTKLVSVLSSHLKGFHLARVQFIGLFVIAVIKVGLGGLIQIATAFERNVEYSSSLRRIERFLNYYELDFQAITNLIISLEGIEQWENIVLCLDRTNWKVGKEHINILLLSAAHKGVSIPLCWSVLSRTGNSATQQRIDLIEDFLNQFPNLSITALVADREFIGKKWFFYLATKKFDFVMRIKSNFKATRKGKTKSIVAWCRGLSISETYQLDGTFVVNEAEVYLSVSRTQKGYIYLASPVLLDNIFEIYKQRWEIETLFKALKSQGFNLENTKLTEPNKIAKLIALCSIAFVWCYKVGEWKHKKTKIRVCSNGYNEYSFFRYGLIEIKKILNNPMTSETKFDQKIKVLSME
ncbi:IS4 family transposase [Bernardetia sp. ABR2-2B]|uniref:IS4 family transposase n=1 Tax=Bernardetia sp. ABR2-2B TaxID=3127472 RepID=UPI0030D35881